VSTPTLPAHGRGDRFASLDAHVPQQPQPDRLAIPTRGPIDAVVRPPGSKSITNRALVAAALASGDSELRGALESDDTRVMADCLVALGVGLERAPDAWRVRGSAGHLRQPDAPLYTGNSGTTARFLSAAATLADGPVVLDGSPRMRQRPIQDLVHALSQLGAPAEVLGRDGCPPLRVHGGGLPGGTAVIDASRSSQYVSAVLLAAPCAQRDVDLQFENGVLVSGPYVELTLQLMRAFGAEVDWSPSGGIHVRGRRGYRGRVYAVEPDASAAAYPFCAAAISGGRVRVEGIPRGSLQADLGLLPILERMGCQVRREPDAIELRGPRPPQRLRGVDVDMNALPDAVLALAVVALFADGPTRIRNVANLRIKETDRLAALETELRRLGARAEAGDDWLRVEPLPEGGGRAAEVETYDDHRMAMSFALAGLRVPGVVIRDPGCVSKTWPDYFAFLERL
jgi:3-phosphoshikimate 1-carboxyvinyltransferase